MKPIDLQGWEIEALSTGQATMICRPTIDQPRFTDSRFNVGDELRVRETWAHDCPHCNDPNCGNKDHIWYKANELPLVANSFSGRAKWRPSICMPEFVTRYKLTVFGMEHRPLWGIGTDFVYCLGCPDILDGKVPWQWFAERWNKSHHWRGSWYRYENNPWVWLYTVEIESGMFMGKQWSNE